MRNLSWGPALLGIKLVSPLSCRYRLQLAMSEEAVWVLPMTPQVIKTLASGDEDQCSSCDCIIKHIPLSVRSASWL